MTTGFAWMNYWVQWRFPLSRKNPKRRTRGFTGSFSGPAMWVSMLLPIRGSISDDVVMTTTKKINQNHNSSKDVVECLFPFLTVSQQPLRLGLPTAPPILLKLDEQSLTTKHKIGVLYCRQGQTTEEEMYNNEFGSANFDDFLSFLGDRIKLKGFTGYNGGLDVKDDTTGTHSIYNDKFDPNLSLMFHVSTLLPFTPNNRQQLMRKRHIGNDMVTIVFQEPGSRAFTPKSVRSQFQHVFVVVRLVDFEGGGGGQPVYSLAISRSCEVPEFGPPLTTPTFSRDSFFLNFLLSKIINAENATYKSEKFTTMAIRTRNEYLKDLYLNFTSGGVAELRGRFSMLNLIKKKTPPQLSPTSSSHGNNGIPGGLSWKLENGCYAALSKYYFIVCNENGLDFYIKVGNIVSWEINKFGLTLYHVTQNNPQIQSTRPISMTTEQSFRLVTKLKSINKIAMETLQYFIRKKANLGFHIQNDGLVTDVEKQSPAAIAGLSCFSRVVKINSTRTSDLNSEQMIDLLKSNPSVEIVVIAPEVVRHLPPATTQHQPHQHNHLNCYGEGRTQHFSPLLNNYHDNYSSSGYGTGSSSFSVFSNHGNTPPPPLPRRLYNNSKSSENIFLLQKNLSYRHSYLDNCYGNRESNLNQRVAALKSAYLTPKKKDTKIEKKSSFFEQDLLKLIDIDHQEQLHQQPPSYSSSPPQIKVQKEVALETRVALLESQLAEERAIKYELKNSLEILQRQNKKLAEDYHGNKRDVERLKLLLL
ncbi:signal-induced proliferation-associated 1-like protein 3 isoform X2 [Folsomia candida]|uniref:signal-induced proliferation-associated 1-like protein 3 isoform X2 n=1 Tax=Folsomia candida TaxID=158441 RepID=UPI001604CAC6|nr:signal-induced proliferation-associated 1-like protein 3 isoform X2 [Folsomia candida]